MIALDGVTGSPCKDFGNNGEVSLDRDVRVQEQEWVNYTVTSPPVVVDNIVVVGSAIGDKQPVESEPGIAAETFSVSISLRVSASWISSIASDSCAATGIAKAQ